MSLGDNLKARRRACRMTVEEVASRLGVSRQTVFRYENGGIATVPSAKLVALAEIYGTTPAVLLGGSAPISVAEEKKLPTYGSSLSGEAPPKRTPVLGLTLGEGKAISVGGYGVFPPEEEQDFFACDGIVHVQDDGMLRLRMMTGDIVAYEHKVPENGKLAVLRLDGKTVVRRYFDDFPEKGTLTLVPEGTGETLTLSGEERKRCELLGHALFFRVPVALL